MKKQTGFIGTVDRECLTEKVAGGQRGEGGERGSRVDSQEKSILGEGNSQDEGLEARELVCLRITKDQEPEWWGSQRDDGPCGPLCGLWLLCGIRREATG